MKSHTVQRIFCALLCLLLCGCGAAKPPAPAGSTQGETEGEPLDLTAFSFYHTASLADACFRLEVKREGDEIRLYAEELFYNGRIVDTADGEEVLERLEELCGTYGMDRWDGFDKSKKRVSDGSTFTLSMTLADGTTVSAHGNNAYPDRYAEAAEEIKTLYAEVMERYANTETEGEDTP